MKLKARKKNKVSGGQLITGKRLSVLDFYNSLNDFKDINRLIDEGESENQYLECKSPLAPQLSRDLKSEFSRHISGFANTGGGIIIWGIRTDQHSGRDVLTQIEPIGSIRKFSREIELVAPLLIEGPKVYLSLKIIKAKPEDTKGVLITYIPGTTGDPIRSSDGQFYLRIGDSTKPMPYETIKRMFLGSTEPDLWTVFDSRLVELQPDGKWKIPIILENNSNAPGKFITLSIEFNNPSACQEITSDFFQDRSNINPGKKIFMHDISGLIYKRLNTVVGNFFVQMKKIKLSKRLLDITITIYAENMRARLQRLKIYLSKKEFRVKEVERNHLY